MPFLLSSCEKKSHAAAEVICGVAIQALRPNEGQFAFGDFLDIVGHVRQVTGV